MEAHQRIRAVLDGLGIARAHFASCLAAEIEPLLQTPSTPVASLVLVNPNRLDVAALAPLDERLTLVTGTSGLPASVVDVALGALPAAEVVRFDGYETAAWSDMVADEAQAVAGTLIRRASSGTSVPEVRLDPAEGEIAGIRYQVLGSGPPLVLLPLSLAPSQWDPIVDRLGDHFTVVRLGGAHLAMVAMLESRGAEPGYQRVIRSVLDEVVLRAGETLLEVGCGTGVLARWIAAHTEGANPIIATDLNPYFLREAAFLAAPAPHGDCIEFRPANAEALPFADASVDIAFSSTVMEECDADKMLAEMVRVTRPGGRVAVVVRAIDAHSVCSVDVEADVKAVIEAPYRSVGEQGCADASLYRRFHHSGLVECRFFPHLLTLRDPNGAAWRYREPFLLAQLDADQRQRWAEAKQRAVAADEFVFASGLHCAVGVKGG